ncbi:deoxynucleoside kinase [bacterium]|nr:deoxynucleoside kinase [bacterium]
MAGNFKNDKSTLIVIEGIDSSGKATQVKLVFEELVKKNYRAMKLEFPDYESNSSALIKMYLNGEFGKDPKSVNPYAASLFFASDRFASYKTRWEKFYKDKGVLISDRYVSSNMIYQAAKFDNKKERADYIDWIFDLEFNKLNLPEPDIIIFLCMPPEFCRKLNDKRLNKITGSRGKDIHEKDSGYMERTYEVAMEVAVKYKWEILNCIEDDLIKPIGKINSEILRIIENKSNGEIKF